MPRSRPSPGRWGTTWERESEAEPATLRAVDQPGEESSVDRITPFDLLIVLALLAMFIVGYAQGVVRRLLGIAAVLFALVLASYLRQPFGAYLANEWTNIDDT